MGIFDWFKSGSSSSNVKLMPDRIWITRQAKLDGMAGDVDHLLSEVPERQPIVLVTYFAEYFEPLQKLVHNRGFDTVQVMVVMADKLVAELGKSADVDPSLCVHLLVCERHPSAAYGERLVEQLQQFPCQFRIVHYVSLDDPLCEMFAGPWVKQVLERLGMRENEAIESNMVARRIQNAQKQITAQVRSDMPANSSREWLKLNRAP